jgi:hypothetical protein
MGFDPLTMAAAGISAGGTLLSAYGDYSSANEQARTLDAQRYYDVLTSQYKAKALNDAANQAMASSQREAMARVEDKNLALSRAQAVNAASGGGSSDASYVNTVAGIEEQGEYNKAVALFAGETEMRQLNYEAQNALIEGQNAANARGYQAGQLRRQGRMKAAGTLLSGAAGFLKRYGDRVQLPGTVSDHDVAIAEAQRKAAEEMAARTSRDLERKHDQMERESMRALRRMMSGRYRSSYDDYEWDD